VIAIASTLAGNLTVLGSIANLIVVQRAAVSGVVIGFWDYFRVGAPLKVLNRLLDPRKLCSAALVRPVV
jgi:Na+/H+ antiporter NhaD/arsenite permease-like protein